MFWVFLLQIVTGNEMIFVKETKQTTENKEQQEPYQNTHNLKPQATYRFSAGLK